MQTVEYERLRAFENEYWWYVAQRTNLIDAVAQLNLPPRANVLDVGCGTGRNLVELTQSLRITGFGVDVSPHAAACWNGDRQVHRCLASCNHLPYPNDSFDAAASVDVLGCLGVDIPQALSEMVRVVRGGGGIVLLAPAYQWMLSKHDAAVNSVHRFTRRELTALARKAGLTVTRVTHRFPLFFPVIAALRLIRRWGLKHETEKNNSDLRFLPQWVNRALLSLARIEHAIVRHCNVPFGSTILLVAKKDCT